MTPREVEPVGIRRGFDPRPRPGGERGVYGSLDPVEEPEWPHSPQGSALRRLRRDLGFGLREASAALSLTIVQLHDLESGRAALDDAGWIEARALLLQRAGRA